MPRPRTDEPYEAQDRGDRGAYDRYLQGMDASMRQKVALTAAHLLSQGHVADMGMGSGAGSHALALLYPALQVIGVDVSETMVQMAGERYGAQKNLRFQQGDIARPCFPPGSLDGIFDSSVLHHVTSFSGYDHDAARRALEVQAAQLREEGVLIVRDFLDPGEGPVWLDLPAGDGDDGDDPARCSTAALFVRFAREFRPLAADPSRRGFACRELDGTAEQPVRAGFRRYDFAHKHAVEFVLRKDWRDDWATEVLEEYTYFTQERFERVFADLGLRVVASSPIRNPWILRHRFAGTFELRAAGGAPLDPPATNYVIVGERALPGQGVALREGRAVPPGGFLSMDHYRDLRTGSVRDVVRRPHLTVDILPWFERGGDVFVLARKSYPRPILCGDPRGTVPLDGSRPVAYVTEPLAVLQDDKPLGQTVEEALAERASLGADELLGFAEGGRYFPSPGGVQEEVRSLFVETAPRFVERNIKNVSQMSGSGLLRAIEAQQLLRAAQVGGLPNARLEVNVYHLLRRLGRGPGPWIGEEIQLGEGEEPARVRTMAELRARPPRRVFRRAAKEDSSGFLSLQAAEFEELDGAGQVVSARSLEFVVPRTLSANTVSVALLRRHGGEVYLGIDDDDLPAAQGFSGNSQILVTPAYRLPREVRGLFAARRWVSAQLERGYGVRCGAVWEVGGRYHPSPGVTPEAVYPLAIEASGEGRGSLVWVPLRDAVEGLDDLQDGHLRTVALRAAHALGLLGLPRQELP